MIKNLSYFINKIKQNKVTDEFVLNYFYFILDLEYELNLTVKILLCNYEEDNTNLKNVSLDLNEKILKIQFCKIIIKDFDCYNLNDEII